jgi:hypothetical protein
MAARPRLAAIEIVALAPVMCVLHFVQLEELLPIRPFFFERRRAITNLNPSNFRPNQLPRLAHVPEILSFGNGPLAQGPAFNCLEQGPLATGLNSRSYQITHSFTAIIDFARQAHARKQDSYNHPP